MIVFAIRSIGPSDHPAVKMLLEEAFDGPGEARLTNELRADGHVVLELGAFDADRLIGVVVFSRLMIEGPGASFPAVALAPVATAADARRAGVATSLIETAHRQLIEAGERLSVVLGEPEFYSRFGYEVERAEGFSSPWQGPYMQAVAWGDAPEHGQLHYAPAFDRL
ncbi:GNAT family N-acetyltransferase [Tianweitania populi]|nr:N-acetyltransferase [Tianweitania populi]